ncbi:hypothetical protein CUA56_24440, partial [Shigella boydii]
SGLSSLKVIYYSAQLFRVHQKKYIKPKPPLEIEIVERLTTPGMRIIFALISGGFIQGASCLTLSRYSPGVQPNSRTNAL